MNNTADGSVLQTVSRGCRRRLVVAMYLCLAAVTLLFGFAPSDSWFVLALGLLVVAFTLYAKLLIPIMKEVTGKKDPELDERQLLVRDRANGRAYGVLGAIFLSVVLYAMLAASPGLLGGVDLPTPRTAFDFALLILLFAHLVVSLPAAMVAWTEPDPPLEEE